MNGSRARKGQPPTVGTAASYGKSVYMSVPLRPKARILLFSFTFLLASITLFAQVKPPAPPPPPPSPTETVPVDYPQEHTTYEPQRLPLFPGCEDVVAYSERKDCADRKLMEFIYGNIQYPQSAVKKGIEGKAVVRFIIEKDGTVSDPIILRDPGAGTGEEVRRVVLLMNEKGIKFNPLSSSGRPLRYYMNLPVNFKLEEEKIIPPPPPPPPPPPATSCGPFYIAEEMPTFPGCEDEEDKTAKKQCSDKTFLEFIHDHFKIPAIHRESGISGTVVVRFVVEKDGRVTNPQVVRSVQSDVDEAALAAVEAMIEQDIRWTPGRQLGRPVRVVFNAPVKIHWE